MSGRIHVPSRRCSDASSLARFGADTGRYRPRSQLRLRVDQATIPSLLPKSTREFRSRSKVVPVTIPLTLARMPTSKEVRVATTSTARMSAQTKKAAARVNTVGVSTPTAAPNLSQGSSATANPGSVFLLDTGKGHLRR